MAEEKRLYRSKPGKLWYGWNRMKGMVAKRDRVVEELGEAAKTGGVGGIGLATLYFTAGIPLVNILTIPVGLAVTGLFGFRTYQNLKEAAFNPAVNSYVADKERAWKNSGAPYKPGIGLRALYGIRKGIGWTITATKGLFTTASFGMAAAGIATVASAFGDPDKEKGKRGGDRPVPQEILDKHNISNEAFAAEVNNLHRNL